MNGNAVVYEIVNKVTREVTAIIGGLVMGDGYVEANTETLGVVRFENPNKDGKLTNEEYYIREVGTHIAADGVTNTDEEYPATDAGAAAGAAAPEAGAEGAAAGTEAVA